MDCLEDERQQICIEFVTFHQYISATSADTILSHVELPTNQIVEWLSTSVNWCRISAIHRTNLYHNLTRSKNWHQQGNLHRNCYRSSPPSPPAKWTLAIAKFSQTQSVCISGNKKHLKNQLNQIDTTKQAKLQSSSWPQKCCPKTHTHSTCWKRDFLFWVKSSWKTSETWTFLIFFSLWQAKLSKSHSTK